MHCLLDLVVIGFVMLSTNLATTSLLGIRLFYLQTLIFSANFKISEACVPSDQNCGLSLPICLQRFGSLPPCSLRLQTESCLTSPIGLSKLISACLLCKGLGLYHCCTKNWLEQVLPFCQLGSEQFRLAQFRRWLVVLFC